MKRASLVIPVLLILSGLCPAEPNAYGLGISGDCVTFVFAKDVPYVPTSPGIVDEMLSLAEVREGDVVYDLGCGDGRIVVSAAKLGAKGVGIDIDPERIRDSNRRAERESVSAQVRFIEQDIFYADIGEASVVTLYLLPSVNMKLRPKLISDLRPGTRIVSNTFSLGDWEPDKTSGLVHCWIVPANITGQWRWKSESGEEMVLSLKQKFQRVKGTLSVGKALFPVQKTELRGNKLHFAVEGKGAAKGTRFSCRCTDNIMIIKDISSSSESVALRQEGSKRDIEGRDY